ncbi:MAG: hypothetical protein NTY31_03730 [Candidatus Falkowbacteria bacterium]|nr:hypothetical protein [Candidatus Falkowbacteria bacterium]
MLQTPMIILPLDTYPNAEALLAGVSKFFTDPDVNRLVSHIKLNDGVHQPDVGGPAVVMLTASLLKELDSEAKIFLDLKIFDVSATLVNVLKKYKNEGFIPDILTVCANCSVDGILKLRRLLPETKLALVSVPTDISQEECLARFGMTSEIKIYNDLQNIRRIYKQKIDADESWNLSEEPFDLIVCSAHELDFLKRNLSNDYGFIVPGIRDEWMKKPDEHQKRTTGVRKALEKGATYVVMGAQMREGNPLLNITPEESRARTIAEINAASVL